MKILRLFTLVKDIVIPAGTVFHCVDGTTREFIEGNYETIIGLTPDTSGDLVYRIDDGMDEWFEEIELVHKEGLGIE